MNPRYIGAKIGHAVRRERTIKQHLNDIAVANEAALATICGQDCISAFTHATCVTTSRGTVWVPIRALKASDRYDSAFTDGARVTLTFADDAGITRRRVSADVTRNTSADIVEMLQLLANSHGYDIKLRQRRGLRIWQVLLIWIATAVGAYFSSGVLTPLILTTILLVPFLLLAHDAWRARQIEDSQSG